MLYHQDGLGSISVLSDVYGNPLNRYTYGAFGNLLSTDESVDSKMGFTGEPRDPSGLIFLRARYYDPATGRFISRDTFPGEITDPLSMNRFAYCGNNPVNYVDPSGHMDRMVQEMLKQYNHRTYEEARQVYDKLPGQKI